MTPELPAKIDRWLEQLSCELVLAEPGTDIGLLPLRELFANVRDRTPESGNYSGLHECAREATVVVESVMDRGGTWTAPDLELLAGLIACAQEARHSPEYEFVKPTFAEQTPPVVVAAPVASPTEEAPLPPEHPLAVNLDDVDLLKEFLTEAQEHLETIEQGILVLEDRPDDRDTLNNIFRSFHTFKGTSGFLNLIPINRLSHELETLLDLARQNKLTITSEIINLILEGGDTLKEMVGFVGAIVGGKRESKPVDVVVQPLIRKVQRAIENPAGAAAAPTAPKKDVPTPAKAASAAAVHEASPFSAKPEIAPAATSSAPAAKPAAKAVATAPAETPKPAVEAEKRPGRQNLSSEGGVVKVDTIKLDALVDLVGEMVIAQSQVAEDADLRANTSQKLARNMAQLGRIVNELQRTAMSLRMVPVRGTFQKMGRLVRDLAQRIGKRVELSTEGEDTELDRNITEELADPLMHMIRNSVDHGIEMPDVRESRGKNPVGNVVLKAYHQGGNIVIEICDDGNGLPKEKLFKKAVEKGLVAPDAQLTDQEIYQLIFAPGFSTAEQITDISGRGVGMDVVRRNIEKLRGKIQIETELGKGTVFKIFLPLTLAIIDGLILAVGTQRFIIPTLSVRESFRPAKEAITTVHERGEVINVRGTLVPLLRLYEHLELEPKTRDPAQSIVLVVESAQAQRCILVDELVGKQEVVIKSLGEQVRHQCLAGAAILGDGTVGLILEPHQLATLGRN